MLGRAAILAGAVWVLATSACTPAGSGSATSAPDFGADAPRTPSPEGAPDSAEPAIARDGVLPVYLLTAMKDVGPSPLFMWEAVPGADRYALVVNVTTGRPYWAWGGTETSVYMGGGSEPPPPDGARPHLYEPMTWMVFAFAEDDTLIGASAARPIAP